MSIDWDYGLAAFSEFVEGVLCVAVDLYGNDGQQSGRGLPSAQPLGLLARPMDPSVEPSGATPTLGAGCLYGWIGSEGWSMPTTDPRMLAGIPEITKGSTLLYSTKSFLLQNGETRDVTLFQRVGDDRGQSLSMVATEGEEAITLRHASGSGIVCMPDGSVVINAEDASNYVQIGSDGITLSGLLKLAGGGVLGDIAGAQPLPLGVPYAAAMAALATALSAIGAATPAAAAACAAGATACGTAAAGLTTKVSAS